LEKRQTIRTDPGKFLMLLVMLLLLSAISGYLMSKPSLVGRVGIDLFYRKYRFLSTWWKGALSVFMVLSVLLIIQGILHFRLSRKTGRWVLLLFLVAGLAGLGATYADFHTDRTHRWLKDRFHTGVYLFWCGWLLVSLFYLLLRKKNFSYEDQRWNPGLPEEKAGS
jgi:hypothetical protein